MRGARSWCGLLGSLRVACDGPPPPPPPEVPAAAGAPAAVPAPPAPAPAPAEPWRDVAVDGQAAWIAFRDDAALWVARERLGAPAGVGELAVADGRWLSSIDDVPDAGPPGAWSPAAGLLAFSREDHVVVRRPGAPDVVVAGGRPDALAFSPAGDRLARTTAEAGEVPTVVVVDVASGKPIGRARPFGGARRPYDSGSRLDVAFVDGERVAALLADDREGAATLAVGAARRWSRFPLSAAGDEFAAAPRLGQALAVAPGGAWVVAGNVDARIARLEVAAGTAPTSWPTGGDTVTALASAPDGGWVVAAGERGPLTVLAVPSGERLARLAAPAFCVALAVSPDGRRVAGGCDGVVRIWEASWAAPRAGLAACAGDSTPPLVDYAAARLPGIYRVDMVADGGDWRPAAPIRMPMHHATRLALDDLARHPALAEHRGERVRFTLELTSREIDRVPDRHEWHATYHARIVATCRP